MFSYTICMCPHTSRLTYIKRNIIFEQKKVATHCGLRFSSYLCNVIRKQGIFNR